MDDKLVRAFAAFRDEVREHGVKNGSKDLLELCDRLRDHQMVELGIQLEDGMGAGMSLSAHPSRCMSADLIGGRALVKREDPAVLIKQREEKAAIAADKAAKKAANAAAAQQQKQAQLEKGRTSPSEMFKPPHSELYSEWDDNGLPTKDKEGTEVSKAGGKKLLKEWKAQEKLHEAFLASQKDGQ
jgi:cysteinyl-tRNA synthetase